MDLISILNDRIARALQSTNKAPIVNKIVILQRQLAELATRLSADSTLSDSDKTLIRNIQYHTSPEFLCGIEERFWEGAAPDYDLLQLPTYAHAVRRGSGGWGVAQQTFHVRGGNYLDDDVKEPSLAPLFHTRGLQLFKTTELIQHVGAHPCCPITKDDGREWLILNYMVPGSPPINVICYYTASKEALDILYNLADADDLPSISASPSPPIATGSSSPKRSGLFSGRKEKTSAKTESANIDGWKRSLKQFWEANQEYCDERFKMIPNVVHGPWPLKMAIGNKPALTGTKLRQTYYRGENYLEVDIDISCSSVATNILSLVRDGSKRLTLDIAITIQGNSEDELPERILCQTRWIEMDFSAAQMLSA